MTRKPRSHVTILIHRGLLSHYNNNLYAFNLLNHAFQKGLVDNLVTNFSNLGRQQEINDSVRFHFTPSPIHLGK